MPIKDNRKKISVVLTDQEYKNLKNYAAINNKSMSAVGREFVIKGLNGEITTDNINFLAPIIREQVKSVMDIQFDRLAAMTAKTCIQAGTAAYLSAEALNSFVPLQNQKSFLDAYEAARKKSVEYLKKGVTSES